MASATRGRSSASTLRRPLRTTRRAAAPDPRRRPRLLLVHPRRRPHRALPRRGLGDWEAAHRGGRVPSTPSGTTASSSPPTTSAAAAASWMTSRSFDGEYIARFIQRLGYGAARGSSSRGGIAALAEMVRSCGQGCPTASHRRPARPRHVAKMGAVLPPARTATPSSILRQPARHWAAPELDAFQVPLPFTRAVVRVGTPFRPARRRRRAARGQAGRTPTRARLARRLNRWDRRLTRRGRPPAPSTPTPKPQQPQDDQHRRDHQTARPQVPAAPALYPPTTTQPVCVSASAHAITKRRSNLSSTVSDIFRPAIV